MQVTPDMVRKYVGGQLEVRNDRTGSLHQGQIEAIDIGAHDTVTVRLNWMAQATGFPASKDHWTNCPDWLTHCVSLTARTAHTHNDWLMLHSQTTGETVTFFPPGNNTLNPNRIKGLTL